MERMSSHDETIDTAIYDDGDRIAHPVPEDKPHCIACYSAPVPIQVFSHA